MISLPVAKLKLEWTIPWQGPPAPHLLRGAIAAAFPENDMFHQHGEEGLINRYPRIQYRWEGGCGLIYGFGDGVESLGQLFLKDLNLRLETRDMTVLNSTCSFSRHQVGFMPILKRYYFRSPWVALNQDNYTGFDSLSRIEQADKLDRILVGNMLSALKCFDVRVGERIYAAVVPKRKIWCTYKNQKLLGFMGMFVTNLDLPSGFGLGTAVSHGYGWIEPVGDSLM